jgi:hypothetical protein
VPLLLLMALASEQLQVQEPELLLRSAHVSWPWILLASLQLPVLSRLQPRRLWQQRPPRQPLRLPQLRLAGQQLLAPRQVRVMLSMQVFQPEQWSALVPGSIPPWLQEPVQAGIVLPAEPLPLLMAQAPEQLRESVPFSRSTHVSWWWILLASLQ